ncbi:hypothetical protein ACN92M_24020 [Paenibacillus polymyxa]
MAFKQSDAQNQWIERVTSMLEEIETSKRWRFYLSFQWCNNSVP